MTESDLDDMEWLADLARCDSFSPCEVCDRCTIGGTPWQEARRAWLKSFREAEN